MSDRRPHHRPAAPAFRVDVRRVALLTPRPEFVGGGSPIARHWMEPLEARRVLSSAASSVMLPSRLAAWADPGIVLDDGSDPTDTSDTLTDTSADDSSDDGSTEDPSNGSSDDSSDDVGTDDSGDASDAQPSSDVWTSTTFIDVVDDNDNVVQSLKVVSSTYGEGSGSDAASYERLSADDLDPAQVNLQIGQTVVTTYDDNGDTQVLTAVPASALPDTWVDSTTRLDANDAEIVEQRSAYEADLAQANTPTDQASQTTQYVDVVDDAGNVVQSFRIRATVFGEDATNESDVSYFQVSADDTSWLVPTSLAAGQSVTWTWDAETGEPVLVDNVPTSALPDTEYDTALDIPTDDPQLAAARDAYNAELISDPGDGWTDLGDWSVGNPPYVCYLPAAEVGAVRYAGGIETMVGGGTLASDAPSATTIDLDGGSDGTSVQPGAKPLQIPMPALPTAADRPVSDVLTAGKKHDDVLDPADASLIALVR